MYIFSVFFFSSPPCIVNEDVDGLCQCAITVAVFFFCLYVCMSLLVVTVVVVVVVRRLQLCTHAFTLAPACPADQWGKQRYSGKVDRGR